MPEKYTSTETPETLRKVRQRLALITADLDRTIAIMDAQGVLEVTGKFGQKQASSGLISIHRFTNAVYGSVCDAIGITPIPNAES